MLSLIIGGSGSGKSAYAEQMLYELSDVNEKYYLATMMIYDEECRRKILRHRYLRRGKGFLTIEQPKDIAMAVKLIKTKESAVLLECLSNLTANEMFHNKKNDGSEIIDKIINDICRLKDHVKHLIIVTNNVFEDGILYEEDTMRYLTALGELNQRFATMADSVTEIVVGIPHIIKGSHADESV